MQTNEFLTTAGAAELLGYSRDRVRVMCEAGRMPGAFRMGGPGGHWRIPKGDVEAILESVRPKKRTRIA